MITKKQNVLTKKDVVFPLLDSKHITTTIYNLKIVECGDYLQVYLYNSKRIKNKQNNLKELNLKSKRNDNESNIEMRSIIRSKLECQRIAKTNINLWKTFITLTFSDNVENIDIANKKFRYFRDKVQRVKKDFAYICIPEFQKRGAVHYHLLSNIDISDKKLIFSQEDNPKFKHVKYWNEGFTQVEKLSGDVKKIIGYISKYMTKDIDNKLFNRRRYFHSLNLDIPRESFINLEDFKHKEFLDKKIQEKELIYRDIYINPYDNSDVCFLEFLKK